MTAWGQGRPQDRQQPHGQPYGQAPYGQPVAQGQPYGQGPYGPPPAWGPTGYAPGWPQPGVWPHGPGRPGLATASAVLAIVTGSLTVLGGLGMLIAGVTGDGDLPTWLLALGLPVGGVLLAGGISLLNRRRGTWVLWSAVAAVAVLLLALLGSVLTLDGEDTLGVLFFVLPALVLPVVTAALSGQRVVQQWAAAGNG